MKILAGTAVLLIVLLAGVRFAFHRIYHRGIRSVVFSSFSASPKATARHDWMPEGCPSNAGAALDPAAIPAIDPCVNGGQSPTPPLQTAVHTITVKFDYDFTHAPVCSGKPSEKCVQLFVVYDISGPKQIKLFSLPPPEHAKGKMTGITATSPKLLFVVGYHRIGVAAQSSANTQSLPFDCNTVVKIEPNTEPVPAPATH